MIIYSYITLYSQGEHAELLSRQSDMDLVSQRAAALLEVNSDARVSHAITQLTTKYQTMLSLSKVRTF